jgi:hypothetical protein
MKTRVTALIGAGATIDLDAPTTDRLTEIVSKKKLDLFKSKSELLRSISKILTTYYQPNKINFEHIIHVLEMLDTYKWGWTSPGNIKFRPPIIPFIKPRYSKFLKGDTTLLTAKWFLIKTIAEEVNKYDLNFQNSDKYDWYKGFWTECNFDWDITTLNYDTTIEKSFNDKIEDGFESCGNYDRFNPMKFRDAPKSTIAHIHGCINFGYPIEIVNQYAYEDTHEDIYKLKSYTEAKETWFGRSTNRTQASEETLIGPIITGLRKVEKLNNYPYSYYQNNFQNAILKNNCLLIVGYSFGDLYLNQVMERINRIHGKDKRIVIITYYGKNYWADNHRMIDFPETNDAYLFFAKAFRAAYPLEGYVERNFIKNDPIRAKNGNVLVFLHGFKEAVTNHTDEIMNFFNGPKPSM